MLFSSVQLKKLNHPTRGNFVTPTANLVTLHHSANVGGNTMVTVKINTHKEGEPADQQVATGAVSLTFFGCWTYDVDVGIGSIACSHKDQSHMYAVLKLFHLTDMVCLNKFDFISKPAEQ